MEHIKQSKDTSRSWDRTATSKAGIVSFHKLQGAFCAGAPSLLSANRSTNLGPSTNQEFEAKYAASCEINMYIYIYVFI